MNPVESGPRTLGRLQGRLLTKKNCRSLLLLPAPTANFDTNPVIFTTMLLEKLHEW